MLSNKYNNDNNINRMPAGYIKSDNTKNVNKSNIPFNNEVINYNTSYNKSYNDVSQYKYEDPNIKSYKNSFYHKMDVSVTDDIDYNTENKNQFNNKPLDNHTIMNKKECS